MRNCPFCGTENEVFFRFCLGCGTDLDEALGGGDDDGAADAAADDDAVGSTPTVQMPVIDEAAIAAAASVEREAEPEAKADAVSSESEPLMATLVRHNRTGQAERPPPAAREEPAAADAADAPAGTPAGRLVLILEDGTDGAVYDLSPDSTIVGREGADINFPNDDFLAPKHAEFFFSGQALNLRPLESTNGVFVQVSHEVELQSSDVFRIGQELLCFELLSDVETQSTTGPESTTVLGSPIPEGAWGRLAQLTGPDTWGAVYLLGGSDIYLGRERGDITFPGDGFVSGLHAVIMQRDGRYFLKDLGSSNGTYFRLRKPTVLRRGALVLGGQQLFRVEH